jgi:hypothetical protein
MELFEHSFEWVGIREVFQFETFFRVGGFSENVGGYFDTGSWTDDFFGTMEENEN